MASHRLVLYEFGEMFVDAEARSIRSFAVARGNLVFDEPGEDVAHTGLAGFVAVEPAHDSAFDDAAHSGNLDHGIRVHHVAGAGAHDREHLARVNGLGRWGGDVRVDVADRDGDAFRETRPGCGLRGERAC